jgi:positive regulator of sigma E activity
MSLTAIIAILLTFPVLLMIRATDEIQPHWKLIPLVTLVVSYVVARVFFIYFPTKEVERVSLLVMLLSTILITLVLIKYKRTNRFKTATKMKHVRVAGGKKRTSKK